MRFFISSTYTDLVRHRKILMDTVMRMGSEVGLIAMEYFGSSELSPVQLSVSKVKEADAYIGVFGWRYGTLDRDSKMSVTEVEYRMALVQRMPLLLYLASDDISVNPAAVDTGRNASRIRKLRKEIQDSHTVQYFTTPEDLARLVAADIHVLGRTSIPRTDRGLEDPPDGPVGPEINPAHPFVLCHLAKPSRFGPYHHIQLYVDLYYDEGTPEYERTMGSVDRVVYQLHKTSSIPVIPMQNRSTNWLLGLRVWGEFWVRATVYFTDKSKDPISMIRYLNISLPRSCSIEGNINEGENLGG